MNMTSGVQVSLTQLAVREENRRAAIIAASTTAPHTQLASAASAAGQPAGQSALLSLLAEDDEEYYDYCLEPSPQQETASKQTAVPSSSKTNCSSAKEALPDQRAAVTVSEPKPFSEIGSQRCTTLQESWPDDDQDGQLIDSFTLDFSKPSCAPCTEASRSTCTDNSSFRGTGRQPSSAAHPCTCRGSPTRSLASGATPQTAAEHQINPFCRVPVTQKSCSPAVQLRRPELQCRSKVQPGRTDLHRAPKPPRKTNQNAAVFVLGGNTNHAAARPPLPIKKRIAAYNYYASGRGEWDGDALGIEDGDGGLMWEGVGHISMGCS